MIFMSFPCPFHVPSMVFPADFHMLPLGTPGGLLQHDYVPAAALLALAPGAGDAPSYAAAILAARWGQLQRGDQLLAMESS